MPDYWFALLYFSQKKDSRRPWQERIKQKDRHSYDYYLRSALIVKTVFKFKLYPGTLCDQEGNFIEFDYTKLYALTEAFARQEEVENEQENRK